MNIGKGGTCHLFIALPAEGILLAQTHWPSVGFREPQGPTALKGPIIAGHIGHRLRTSDLPIRMTIYLITRSMPSIGWATRRCSCWHASGRRNRIGTSRSCTQRTFAVFGQRGGRKVAKCIEGGSGRKPRENGLKRENGKMACLCKKQHMAIGS